MLPQVRRKSMKLQKAFFGIVMFLLAANSHWCAAEGTLYATSNDVAALRTVLSLYCGADQGFRVLSDVPSLPRKHDNTAGWPSSLFGIQLVGRPRKSTRWPHVHVCPAIRIVSGERIDTIFARDNHIPHDWRGFYAEFPGANGLISASLPIFSPDRRSAVVYLEWKCGPLCGSGFYIELTKKEAGWQISRRETAWIS